MSKFIKISAILLTSTILTACGANEYSVELEKGNKAVESKNFEAAISYYKNAQTLSKENGSAITNYNATKEAYFNNLYEKADEALSKKMFTEARELYAKAYKLDKTQKDDLLDKKKKTEDLERKQKEFDKYTTWVIENNKNITGLSQEWRNSSTDLKLGKIQKAEFLERLQQMLGKSEKSLNEGENMLLEVSGELTVVHSDYVKQMNEYYNSVLSTIYAVKTPNKPIEEIVQNGVQLNEIQSQQAIYSQSLKVYAETEGIKYKN